METNSQMLKKMKNQIMIMALGLLISVTVKAQNTGRHEIRVSYSEGTAFKKSDFVNGFATALTIAFLGSNYEQKSYKETGVFSLGYRNQLSERLKVGVDFGYSKAEQILTPKASNKENKGQISKKSSLFIAMPVAEYSYVKTEWLNFYGSAAAGINLNATTESENGKTAKDHKLGFAYQISPAALRVGKKLAGFAELGYGHKGIITAGVSYKF